VGGSGPADVNIALDGDIAVQVYWNECVPNIKYIYVKF
jgi:hypothetical protein